MAFQYLSFDPHHPNGIPNGISGHIINNNIYDFFSFCFITEIELLKIKPNFLKSKPKPIIKLRFSIFKTSGQPNPLHINTIGVRDRTGVRRDRTDRIWKMPLGKYYCDYCDKEFQDTAYARKRHLQGVQHQRAKSLWYHSLRANQINPSGDPFPTLGVCNRFVTTGSCPYGDSCKYLHPKQNPQSTTTPGTTVTNFTDNTQSLDMMEPQQAGGASLQGNILRDGLGISLGNLPPSLKPPPEGGYSSLPFVDWG